MSAAYAIRVIVCGKLDAMFLPERVVEMDWKPIKAVLVDLDGTLFRGNQIIPGALEFMRYLHDASIPYLYFTNNSTRTPEEVSRFLNSLGFQTAAEEVYTSSMAVADLLRGRSEIKQAFVLGEEGLTRPLEQVLTVHTEPVERGWTSAEVQSWAVVSGLDRGITYDKLATALKLIMAGAAFFGTNTDVVIPDAYGVSPGSGSFLKLLELAAHREPEVVGKPNPKFVQVACQRLHVAVADTLVLGDNPETDIAAGRLAGARTALVSTGIPLADAGNYGADIRVGSLIELM